MKKKLMAVFSACLLIAAQALTVSADWNDWNTGYNDYYDNTTNYEYNDNTWDNTWTDTTTDSSYTGQLSDNEDDIGYYTDSDSDSGSSSQNDDVPIADPFKDAPVTVKLLPTKIVDKKFTAELYIDGNTDITAADLTITYDSKVLKLNKTTINKKIKGTLAAAETAPGTVQLQYTSDGGSQESYDDSSETTDSDSSPQAEENKPGYITLDFEIIDATERSTVLYISVNSLRDLSATEVTYRADGTIIQIEGAVPVDAAADESMYSELRVAKSDSLVLFESIGLTNVKQVTFSDTKIATAEEKGIRTLEDGLTNMTVEFADGSIKYYRLVVSETAPVVTTTAAEGEQPVVTESQTAQPAVAEPENTGEIIKTETKSDEKVKYMIIYVLVLVAVIAIFAEFFYFFGNPYKRAFAVMSQRKSEKQAMQEALYGEENGFYPEEQEPDEDSYEDDYTDSYDGSEEAPYNGEQSDEDGRYSDENPEDDNFDTSEVTDSDQSENVPEDE